MRPFLTWLFVAALSQAAAPAQSPPLQTEASLSRNPGLVPLTTSPTTAVASGNPPVDWDTATGRNVWSVGLGHETFGRPVVAGDTVYVGSDNSIHMNPAYQQPAGVLVAFHAKDGEFLWQDVATPVERGLRDWLLPSTSSTPYGWDQRSPAGTVRCQNRGYGQSGEHR
jgi:outer membrane protein assembly factor BamB